MGIFKKIFKRNKKTPQLLRAGTNYSGTLDVDKIAKEAYLKNVPAFACIREIAQAVSSVSWEVHEKEDDGSTSLVTNHPFNAVLEQANPDESFSHVMYKASAYLVFAGNSFLKKTVLETRKIETPSEIFVVPNSTIAPLQDRTNKVVGYVIEDPDTKERERFLIDPITNDCEIKHVKLFNPTGEFYGSSPTETAAREIDSSNHSVDWNLNLIRNQGNPGMVITLVADLEPDQFEEFEEYIEEKFSGPSNAGRNLILTGEQGTNVKPYSLSPSEMQFIESNRDLSRRIALAYGVPPMLLGIPGDSTFNNQRAARQAFYETTVSFYLKLLRDQLTYWIFGDNSDRFVLKYNIDNVPALEDRMVSKWRRVEKNTFLTINEKRKLAGFGPVDGGNVILVASNMVPLNLAGQSQQGVFTEEEKDLIKNYYKNV